MLKETPIYILIMLSIAPSNFIQEFTISVAGLLVFIQFSKFMMYFLISFLPFWLASFNATGKSPTVYSDEPKIAES